MLRLFCPKARDSRRTWRNLERALERDRRLARGVSGGIWARCAIQRAQFEWQNSFHRAPTDILRFTLWTAHLVVLIVLQLGVHPLLDAVLVHVLKRTDAFTGRHPLIIVLVLRRMADIANLPVENKMILRLVRVLVAGYWSVG